MPHTDLGIFMARELRRRDSLTELEHWWKNPVELILGLFALLDAGVELGGIGAPTLLVLACRAPHKMRQRWVHFSRSALAP